MAAPYVQNYLQPILSQAVEGQSLTAAQWQEIIRLELVYPERAAAWGISPDNVEHCLHQRLEWLLQVAPAHKHIPGLSQPLQGCLELYWILWLPLALSLKQICKQRTRPLIQGILGGQGTGKTTLTLILRHLLSRMGYNAVGLSIDDIYKTYTDRIALRQEDPRLKWRGPPGTHDIGLGISTLQQVHTAAPTDWIALPRFDKSLHDGEGDRVQPEMVKGVDILLFEGWFLGTRPVDEQVFDQAPPPINTEADRQFARDINHKLNDYLPLWELLDRLMILYPEDYRISKLWRQQAEHQMKAQGKSGMSDEMIDQFVEYFWRALHPDIFIAPLKQDRTITNLVVEINLSRQPQAIYVPPSS